MLCFFVNVRIYVYVAALMHAISDLVRIQKCLTRLFQQFQIRDMSPYFPYEAHYFENNNLNKQRKREITSRTVPFGRPQS